jgi:hypothetical protein
MPVTDTRAYAEAAVEVLAPHFPDLTDPVTKVVVTELIEHHARNPQVPFEVIVDDPVAAKWRLRPDSQDRARVLLFIHRTGLRGNDDALRAVTVNDALRALET